MYLLAVQLCEMPCVGRVQLMRSKNFSEKQFKIIASDFLALLSDEIYDTICRHSINIANQYIYIYIYIYIYMYVCMCVLYIGTIFS